MASSSSMDWPLSRDERKQCVMRLYERDINAANELLEQSQEKVAALKQEVRYLRRSSWGSSSTASGASLGSPTATPAELEASPTAAPSFSHSLDRASGTPRVQALDPLRSPRGGTARGAGGVALQAASRELMSPRGGARGGACGGTGSSVGSDSGDPDAWAAGGDTGGVDRQGLLAQPLSPAEAHLCRALTKFYKMRQCEEHTARYDRIARRHTADGIPELWAAIGLKHALPPVVVVHMLAASVCPLSVFQWPQGQVPLPARRAIAQLSELVEERAGADGCIGANALAEARAEVLWQALASGGGMSAGSLLEVDAVAAVAYHGCPDHFLRPAAWRCLLGLPSLCEVALQERREAYFEFREQAFQAHCGECHSNSINAHASQKLGCLVPELRVIEAEARAAWKGEQFMAKVGVLGAVTALALTHSSRLARHVNGACEIAALLLFALSCGGQTSLQEAEADAFWCMCAFFDRANINTTEEFGLSKSADRVHRLLERYDPGLADLLDAHGLRALPATRLGVAFCTRAGFSLADCVRLWDALLADPLRADFSDHIVLALLILSRSRLLRHEQDVGAFAEALLAAPMQVDVESMLRAATAIGALDRRCGPGSAMPFPRPSTMPLDRALDGALDGTLAALGAAQTRLSTLWGKMRERVGSI